MPDDVVIAMVIERIGKDDCRSGFMLDGFPRTRPQAEALDRAMAKAGAKLDAVVLDRGSRRSCIVQRITGRRSDPETGKIYHLEFQPPPPEVAGRLVQRKDDTEEACRARLAKYHSETTPIIPFYRDKGILREVDGVGTLNEVTERLERALRASS